jgi:hypothetical protein
MLAQERHDLRAQLELGGAWCAVHVGERLLELAQRQRDEVVEVVAVAQGG